MHINVVQDDYTGLILSYYDGSLLQALMHLFPEIGLTENKFLFIYSTLFVLLGVLILTRVCRLWWQQYQ